MHKLLICGDSFSAPSNEPSAWTSLIKQHFEVTNLSQRGCSEYKIYKQINSQNLNKYDSIIISHTSPYRIYTPLNNFHAADPLYKDACFIYTDVKENSLTNSKLNSVVDFFENHFDLEYAEYIHNLILSDIEKLCPKDTLHLSHLEWKNLYRFSNHIDFNNLFVKQRGNVNHYNIEANEIIYKKIKKNLL